MPYLAGYNCSAHQGEVNDNFQAARTEINVNAPPQTADNGQLERHMRLTSLSHFARLK